MFRCTKVQIFVYLVIEYCCSDVIWVCDDDGNDENIYHRYFSIQFIQYLCMNIYLFYDQSLCLYTNIKLITRNNNHVFTFLNISYCLDHSYVFRKWFSYCVCIVNTFFQNVKWRIGTVVLAVRLQICQSDRSRVCSILLVICKQ